MLWARRKRARQGMRLKLARAMLVVVLVAAGVLLVAVQQGVFTGAAVAQRETVRFGYVPAPANAIPIIALRKGFFEQEGLRVEETRASFAGSIFQQLANNDLEVMSAADMPAVFLALNGGEFTIIAQHERSNNDEALVSRTESNITRLEDLAGKRVGLSFTSIAQYNLYQRLKEKNVSNDAVTIVDLAPQNMAAALSRGDVDAIFTWEPVPTKIVQGLGGKVSSLTPNTTMLMQIYASKQFSQRAEAQKKFLKALLRAQEFIRENPGEAIKIVAKETALDEETLSKMWGKWKFEVTPFKDAKIMAEQARWAIETNLTPPGTKIPDFAARVDSQPLAEALAG